MQSVTILISDDDRPTGEFYHQLLVRAGYDAQFIAQGIAADTFALCCQHPPDILITDVFKPGYDGYWLCRSLRSDPRTAAIGIMVISGAHNWSLDDANITLRAGADMFLPKPISADRLLRAVRDLSATHDLGLRLHGLTGFPPWPVLERVFYWFTTTHEWALLRVRWRTAVNQTYVLARAIYGAAELAQIELRIWVAHDADDRRLLVLGTPTSVEQIQQRLQLQFGANVQFDRTQGGPQRKVSLPHILEGLQSALAVGSGATSV